MEWINVDTDTPNVDTLGGKEILVLVNGKVFLCTVIQKPRSGYVDAYLTDNNLLYSDQNGWCGDARFAKPTHWMPLPPLPSNRPVYYDEVAKMPSEETMKDIKCRLKKGFLACSISQEKNAVD